MGDMVLKRHADLKGHGFSRAVSGPDGNAALAAEGMQGQRSRLAASPGGRDVARGTALTLVLGCFLGTATFDA
jgi:hypothetical protein